ncbi:hypothetical protein AMTR_s00048p00092440 [Amborella trichopoda]|uniref:Survival motor neuron Tudor domain-containing protein n=1 Tax=Amborella trichopoda TaxID=13333 RepID=U5CZY6_AMBTC|nr:hypothetical protein AMTR_s00048p00092440 [Amborella trichopoda]
MLHNAILVRSVVSGPFLHGLEYLLCNISLKKYDEGEHKAEELEDKEWEDHNSETDISVVINAWYAAGFYTGKYYSEQSTKRRQP